jgi:hypothetical protein
VRREQLELQQVHAVTGKNNTRQHGSGWQAAATATALALAFAGLLFAQPAARADSLPGAYSTRIMLTGTAHSATKGAYMRVTITAKVATQRVAHASMTAYKARSTSGARTATGIYFTRIGTIFPTTPPTPRATRTPRVSIGTAAINPAETQQATSTGSAPTTPVPTATLTPAAAAPSATP